MTASHSSAFVHRAKRNGTIESVCRRCFATVGTAAWETELDRAEKNHTCDPNLLARLKRMGRKV